MTEPIDAAPDAVAAVLADAFTNDPLFSWVFPDDHERCLLVWWTYLAEQIDASGNGELWLAADGNAAAMWYPPNFATSAETAEPDQTPDTESDTEAELGSDPSAADDASEAAPDPFIEMLGPLVGDRMGDVLHTFGTISGAHPGEAHWYLAAVGTTTHTQSRGHGAALLQPALDRCDEQGLPAYLESSNPRNLAFYHRLGFEVTGELRFGPPTNHPDGDVLLTQMWRPAR